MRIRSTDPIVKDAVWEWGTAQVKRTIRKLYEYAKVDFEVPDNEIDDVVRTAISMLPIEYYDDDEILWETINLDIIEK